jgi:hypothetical protein
VGYADVAHEGVSALTLLSLMQRMHDALPPELEAPVRLAAALLAQDYGGGLMRLPPRSVQLLEACMEVLCRLAYKSPQTLHAICAGNMDAENRCVLLNPSVLQHPRLTPSSLSSTLQTFRPLDCAQLSP